LCQGPEGEPVAVKELSGRRVTISIGLIIITGVLVGLYIIPADILLKAVSPLPLVGIPLQEGGPRMLTVAGILLMFAGFAWACININSLPMVVDMTSSARIGTYTGLYYLFSTLSAIVGPNVNGWIIQLTGNNYNNIMLVAPIFMVVALVLIWGVKRGEANKAD
jgi:MFS-type transporter involved in bile tolerance (Atg22 family)